MVYISNACKMLSKTFVTLFDRFDFPNTSVIQLVGFVFVVAEESGLHLAAAEEPTVQVHNSCVKIANNVS